MSALIAGAPTQAASPRAQFSLEYRADAACPGEEDLRREVAAQLGYDPFDQSAPARIVAQISKEQDLLTARFSLLDDAGRDLGERVLVSERDDCQELGASLALAIATAIDPFAPGPTKKEDPPPPVDPPPPPAPEKVEVERPVDGPAFRLHASVGPLLALGVSPLVTGGLVLQLGLQRASISFGIEGRADLPTSVRAAGGKVSASLLAGGAWVCWHIGLFKGCGLVTAGAIRGAGHDLPDARVVNTPFVGIGARVGVEWSAVDGLLILGGHADVLGSVISTTLQVSGEDVWRSSPIAGSLGATVTVVIF